MLCKVHNPGPDRSKLRLAGLTIQWREPIARFEAELSPTAVRQ